ncbi:hypothetical protein BGAL_0536g00080 [Botrytis galanthina]|uniref:Uncharacterized protein n=1 Tax=Botrytis galanthina TaxID=278940 RepID=A0A4S8QKF1_9HELO|nr:hypothetical protein BGAL_0536g00080 [Botrytis galanthina]
MTRKKADSKASTHAIYVPSDTESSESDSSFVAKDNKTGKELQKMSQLAPRRQKDPIPSKK